MRETQIEAYLVAWVKAQGGHAYKFTSPQRRGMPDRLVLWPNGRLCFVECKAPGKSPTPAQAREHARLRALGFEVHIIDHPEAVDCL